MRNYIYTSILGVMFMIQGCSDWLNVKPSDRVSEENAFSTISGFKQALNGIYVELNQSDLYGRALTAEFVEILAQRYAINEEATANLLLSKYEYGGSDAKSRASAIWAKAYNLIANTNLLVKNCDVNRSVLPDDYYHIVKGEALALRAMLHFDLFRLFGPVYGKDSTVTSIPYYKEFVLDVKPSLLGNEFIQQVIDDLSEAEENLQEYDPVITFGPKGDRLDNFKSDRNLRLNYYAVQALLSRVYLYRGNNAKALEVKFAADNLEIIEGLAPEALTDLPAPTHAFIGGSSGNLKEIVKLLIEKNPQVRIVINCITLETVSEALETAKEFGFEENEIVQLNASRSKAIGRYHMMMGENPIYIITLQNPGNSNVEKK